MSKHQKGDTDPSAKAEQLEQEIVAVRENLGSLVSELDQRRHRAFDIPLQLRQHARPLLFGALALTGVVVGGLVWRHRRRHANPDLASRLAIARERVLHAIGRESPRMEPGSRKRAPVDKASAATRILMAAAAGGASILGKRLALSLVEQLRTPASTSGPRR